MTLTIEEIDVADPADTWSAAGFGVDPDARCRVGGVAIRLVGRGTGILAWSLSGPSSDVTEVDGIPTRRSCPRAVAPGTHSNGVVAIDHVVLLSPDLTRTRAAMAGLGATPRRERDAALGDRPIRQVFYRFGAVIVEVVGSPATTSDGPSTLWGITFVAADVDATAAYFGDRAAPVKDAVQPGRRISTLAHRDLGMSVPTAIISARRRRGDPAAVPILVS